MKVYVVVEKEGPEEVQVRMLGSRMSAFAIGFVVEDKWVIIGWHGTARSTSKS